MLMHPAKPPDLDDVERRLTLLCLGLGHLLERAGEPEPEELGALLMVAREAQRDVRVLLNGGAELDKANGEEG